MNNLLTYAFKINIYLVIFYSIYWIAFRHTTFHRLNRWYLLLGFCFSFILPFIQLTNQAITSQSQVQVIFDGFDDTLLQWQSADHIITESTVSIFSLKTLFLVVYFLFISLFMLRYIRGLKSIWKLKHTSEKITLNGFSFFDGILVKQPFTFLKWIFIPHLLYNDNDRNRILEHENAHAEQWHTLDLLVVDLTHIFLWFNPFVIFYRQSLKQVHEFLADAKVLETDKVKADYLNLLSFTTQKHGLTGIASQFYYLTIKNRIKMITKHKTKQIYRLAYLLVIPVVLVTTLAFSNSPIKTDAALATEDNIPDIKPLAEKDIIRIASGWGMREHPVYHVQKMHKGIDIVAEKGAPVIATADGKVIEVTLGEEGKGYGHYIVINHGKTYSTVYTQLSEFKVQLGQMVKKGDVVGLVGSSGLSTGPHLHYEVRKNGEQVNPADYFKD